MMKLQVGKKYVCRAVNNIKYVEVVSYDDIADAYVGKAVFTKGDSHITSIWNHRGKFLQTSTQSSWDLVDEYNSDTDNVVRMHFGTKHRVPNPPYLGSFKHAVNNFQRTQERLEKERAQNNEKALRAYGIKKRS
jgi:hypothetical protein